MGATARRATLALASTVLVLGALTGCGGSDDNGDSGASGRTTKDDFCTAFKGLFTSVLAEAGKGDMSDAVAAVKDWAADMQDVGTPDEMPEDARKGFEVFIDAAAGIDEDASLDDLQHLGDDLSQSDQDAADAFGDWATKNCPAALPDLGDLPSDRADLPSDPG